jgi:N-methylhydantoinase A
MDQAVARFHRRHEELFTYSAPDQEVVLVNARLAVIGQLPTLPSEPTRPDGAVPTPRAHRRAYLGSWTDLPVYDLDTLPSGVDLAGPALFESPTTTVLLRPGERAHVTPHGWLDVQVASP